MRLIINNIQIEMPPGITIARTLQVNDIGSVSTRQASYTSTFSIPKTANNTKAFDMLGIFGNDSNIPYQKNECYLYSESGECIVYKGWAIINETNETYKCNIYDGIVDFYKAIDNRSLADLDLTALAHDKTVPEVLSTQNLSKPYVYILADYNGKALFDGDLNIDYLVPAVKATWILGKIEQFTGFAINGSFKTNPDFTNLYLTQPKATPPVLGESIVSGTDLYPSESAGPVYTFCSFGYSTLFPGSKLITYTNQQTLIASEYIKFKATFEINPLITDGDGYALATFNGNTFLCDGATRTVSALYTLGAGGTITFPFSLYDVDGPDPVPDFFISCQFNLFTNDAIFEEEFGGMSIKNFMNEILWRFNLTMFKDKYENSYTLKYLSEILNAQPIDWSDKFQSLDNENYIYGNYGQRSWLRHKYNDENSFFNDGYLDISNVNLPESVNIIQSQVYSPDFNPSSNLGFTTNVYKFWDKEVKDNGDVSYKPLANRFYFIRAIASTLTGVTLVSEILSQTAAITNCQKESALKLPFKGIVDDYYPEMSRLLNQSKVYDVILRLNENDVINMDFSKPVYIKQLGGSFLVNKISNFIPYKDTKVELVKIS